MLYRTLRKVTSTNMRKTCTLWLQYVLLLLLSFLRWFSDDRRKIHAPVLHDASQIAYCRYLGRASLPPITSGVFDNTFLKIYLPSAKSSKLPSHQVFGVLALEVNKILQATPSKLGREKGTCATTIYVQQQQSYYTIRVLVVRTPVSSLSFQVQHTITESHATLQSQRCWRSTVAVVAQINRYESYLARCGTR